MFPRPSCSRDLRIMPPACSLARTSVDWARPWPHSRASSPCASTRAPAMRKRADTCCISLSTTLFFSRCSSPWHVCWARLKRRLKKMDLSDVRRAQPSTCGTAAGARRIRRRAAHSLDIRLITSAAHIRQHAMRPQSTRSNRCMLFFGNNRLAPRLISSPSLNETSQFSVLGV